MTTEVRVRLEGSSGVAHDYKQTELRRCKRCPNLFPPNGLYYWVREYCLVQSVARRSFGRRHGPSLHLRAKCRVIKAEVACVSSASRAAFPVARKLHFEQKINTIVGVCARIALLHKYTIHFSIDWLEIPEDRHYGIAPSIVSKDFDPTRQTNAMIASFMLLTVVAQLEKVFQGHLFLAVVIAFEISFPDLYSFLAGFGTGV